MEESRMFKRKITKQHLIEILILPIIFVLILMVGIYLLLSLNINDYFVFTGWCIIATIIVIIIIAGYTFIFIKKDD